MWWLGAMVAAASPTSIAVQGAVFDTAGTPVEGSIPAEFAIESPPGTPVWTSGVVDVSLEQGSFSAVLGSASNPIDSSVLHPDGAEWTLQIDNQEWARQSLVAVPSAIRTQHVAFAGLSDVPADIADGDDVRPPRAVAGNWDFEQGPAGILVGDSLPGWRITGSLAALDHAAGSGRDGGFGFGADNCCDPASGTWSLHQFVTGNLDGQTVQVSVDAWSYNGDPDSGACAPGQEFVSEDDMRIWLTAYAADGTQLGTSYSIRHSAAWANAGAPSDRWATVSHQWVVPSGTRIVGIELFADDENDTCQAQGYRGRANSGVVLDNFSFSVVGQDDSVWWPFETGPGPLP